MRGLINRTFDWIADHTLAVEKKTASQVSVNSNSNKWVIMTPPQGAICIVGYYLEGGATCSVYFVGQADNGDWQLALRNFGGSVQNVKVTAYFLKYSGGGVLPNLYPLPVKGVAA